MHFCKALVKLYICSRIVVHIFSLHLSNVYSPVRMQSLLEGELV